MPDTDITQDSIKRFGSATVASNPIPQQSMPQMPNTAILTPPQILQTKNMVEINKQNLLEIKALLLTLSYLNQSLSVEKQNKPFEDEDSFRLTKAFIKGCKEAGLTSEQTQKLLDELLTNLDGINQPVGITPQPPRKINPYLQIVFNIQRKLGL